MFRKISLIPFLFVLSYLPTLQWIWESWFARDSYYSHGILVPLITALLIWQKRHLLKDIKIEPSAWGFGVFVAGITVHVTSLLCHAYYISGFSIIIVFAGLILDVYGKNMLKEILFPLTFLIFMVPLPTAAIIGISFHLKLMSASMATAMLNVMNVPAIQEGNFIRMSHASVVVEDVCSGLRSLISMMALGALFSYWMKSGKIKKSVLFFSSIPIALITNTFRIMILAIIGEFFGIKYITGALHQIFGILVFVLAFLLLSRIEKLLE